MTTFQIARADGKTLEIQGKMANRHGLIAGATGTGKTVTLRRMAEASAAKASPYSWSMSKAICRASRKPVPTAAKWANASPSLI